MNFITRTCVSGCEVHAALIQWKFSFLPFIGNQFIGITLLRSKTVVCKPTCKNAVGSISYKCGLIEAENVGYSIEKSSKFVFFRKLIFSA